MENIPLQPYRKHHFPPDATRFNNEIVQAGLLPAANEIYEGIDVNNERPFPWPLQPPIIGYNDHGPVRLAHRVRLQAIQPTASAVKTSEKSQTHTPASLLNIPANEQLTSIVIDPFLWQTLTRYVLGNGQQINETPAPIPRRRSNQSDMEPGPNLQEFQINLPSAWEHGNQTFPTRFEQIFRYNRIIGWWSDHVSSESTVVNSEAAVQDDFHTQFLTPTNMFLKFRFGGPHSHLPGWSRICNRDAVSEQQNFLSGVRAGHPDFLLHPSHESPSRAFVEVKTWWSYPSRAACNIYSKSAIFGGTFIWGSVDTSAKIMMQVWGEIHRYNAPIGFWTNGRVAFIAIRTGEQQLTLSPLRDWIDADIYFGLLGISFMVENAGYGGPAIGQLINIISPPGVRQNPAIANLHPIPNEYLENEEIL